MSDRYNAAGYVFFVAVLVGAAGAAYQVLAPRFRPLTIADLARPDVQDSPERIIRKIDRDGLLHDLRPHATATHDGISYATNGDGLRDDHEYQLVKKPGVRRVIMLGDSFVFGWGLPLAQTMTKQLASLMDSTKWEFLNLGVPAYNTANEVQFLEERGLKYHPDFVILMYHPNDASGTAASPFGDAAATYSVLTNFYGGEGTPEERQRVAEYLQREGQPLAPAWNVPVATSRDRLYLVTHFLPFYRAQLRATLDRLEQLARDHGFQVTVAVLPELDRPWENHPFGHLYQSVCDEMKPHSFGVINLYDLLRHHPNPDLMLWGYDGHTSAFANRIIAYALADHLEERIKP
jgi:hypothetical protein